jgi:serine/threonine-protein kinase
MKRHVALLLASVLTLGAIALPLRAAGPDDQLPRQALGLLEKSCFRCHGQTFKVPGLNVRDRTALVSRKGGDGKTLFVVPGKPEASALFAQVQSGEMPAGGPRFTPEQVDLIKRWIEAGAPFPQQAAAPRAFLHDDDTLRAISRHLARVPASRKRFQRYFTLANVANDPTVDEAKLRLFRAALSKVVNSLSLEPELVLPVPIDARQTVFVVDVTDLGWERRNVWDEVLKKYPYGLTHKYDRDPALKKLAESVAAATGTELPWVRADWFITTATRPPLYHTILGLPDKLADLEKGLNVDREKAFLNDQAVRAGVINSGVSHQPRLIERVPTHYGAYWISYDFKEIDGRRNLQRFPLGPVFKDNPFERQAFQQDGGEIVFNLPNGLQGYLLVDGKGKRLDDAPTQVVEDSLKITGTSTIHNGLSCMVCHSSGIKTCTDVMRTQSTVKGDALAKLRRLHPTPAVMNRYFRHDEERFRRSLDKVVGPFLGADRARAATLEGEPILEVCRHYFGELSLEQAARELGIDNPQDLKQRIRRDAVLRQTLGLGPLLDGTLKREGWEERLPVQTLFQYAARSLGRGTPVLAD